MTNRELIGTLSEMPNYEVIGVNGIKIVETCEEIIAFIGNETIQRTRIGILMPDIKSNYRNIRNIRKVISIG